MQVQFSLCVYTYPHTCVHSHVCTGLPWCYILFLTVVCSQKRVKATGQATAASLGVAGSTPLAPLGCANSSGNPCSQERLNWQDHPAFPKP